MVAALCARSGWWVGTVLPHGDSRPADLLHRIGRAEEFYARHGVVARFQISPPACPAELDGILAERGYRRHSPVSLQVARTTDVLAAKARTREITTVNLPISGLAAVDPPISGLAAVDPPISGLAAVDPPISGLATVDPPIADHAVEGRTDAREPSVVNVLVDEQPSREWFTVWHAVHGHGGDSPAESESLGRLALPSAYVSVLVDDAAVAVGRAVVDASWAGVFGMATLPQARGTGAGGIVLTALANWAGKHRAGRMYLQVERDNVAALRLYRRAGFSELCSYHYRVHH